jgi:hypothetical protein
MRAENLVDPRVTAHPYVTGCVTSIHAWAEDATQSFGSPPQGSAVRKDSLRLWQLADMMLY